MGIEIERKYRVHTLKWIPLSHHHFTIRQGYLSTLAEQTIRVRCSDTQAWLTLKNKAHHGKRKEFEYPIPMEDALDMLDEWASNQLIHKTRYHVMHEKKLWEVDVFHGPNEGLVIAEIELSSTDEPFNPPTWVGEEVTEDHRYSNSNLSTNPFQNWR